MTDTIGVVLILAVSALVNLPLAWRLFRDNPDADKCEHGVPVTADKPCGRCTTVSEKE